MRSSYIANDFGSVLSANVVAFRPLVAIELGVLDGYSTLHIARGLKRNFETIALRGHLHAYDLFEQYQYKHGTQVAVQQVLNEAQVAEYVTLHQADAYTVHEQYANQSVNFLHIDISNTGETVHRMIEAWDAKLVTGGVICFEGGSVERDQVEWMVQYRQPAIKTALETNPMITEKYVFGTYLKFPSMTVLLKKHD